MAVTKKASEMEPTHQVGKTKKVAPEQAASTKEPTTENPKKGLSVEANKQSDATLKT